MKCPACNKEIENGSVFCEYCGTCIKKSKKGLWITLGVICVLIVAGVVVNVVCGQQRKITKLEEALQSLEENRLLLEEQLEDERKAAEQLRQAVAEAERDAELAGRGYVNLGLPSGTYWKNANEGGDYARYTYDEAVNRWGSKLPTKAQLQELKGKCKWNWTTQNGVNGYKVTGPNGNSIFLPAAGYRYRDGDVLRMGANGNYWSTTNNKNSNIAERLYFDSDVVKMDCGIRDRGRSVRLTQNKYD